MNKKYWKAPIVLGGLGASVYYVIDNSSEMNLFLENWGYETDDDPLTESNFIVISSSNILFAML